MPATSFTYIMSVAAFMLPWQSSVITADTLWPEKLKTFTVWSFSEKVG